MVGLTVVERIKHGKLACDINGTWAKIYLLS